MKTGLTLLWIFACVNIQAAEIVDVRIHIPMNNEEPRIKDYYVTTEGANLKKDLVVKIVRTMNVTQQGKKNVGEIKAEIGQLRILSVHNKVAVAREYKLFSKDSTPLTESIGFMLGDQAIMEDSFIDKSPRKPSSEEISALKSPVNRQQASLIPAPATTPQAVPSERPEETPMLPEDAPKIEVKIFPEKI